MIEIRALREQDDRGSFRSGDEDLDRFFRQFAGQNQFRHHLGVTYVAVDGQNILGFATVSAAHVEIDPGTVPKGSTTSFSFRVPNEKDNASTVSLEVDFPTDHPIPAVSGPPLRCFRSRPRPTSLRAALGYTLLKTSHLAQDVTPCSRRRRRIA